MHFPSSPGAHARLKLSTLVSWFAASVTGMWLHRAGEKDTHGKCEWAREVPNLLCDLVGNGGLVRAGRDGGIAQLSILP